jgi:hypothetical protein
MRRMDQPRLGTQVKKTEYLEQHLFNELRWLLSAAREWRVQYDLELGLGGYHVQVYAMDSACLHARALFEFFTKPTGANCYGCDQFLGTGARLVSTMYTKGWDEPLHAFLMHAQDRSSPVKLKTVAGGKEALNRMPVEFAREILRLWEKFEGKLGSQGADGVKLQGAARERRIQAIDAARCVADSVVAKHHAATKQLVLKPVFT